GTDSLELLLVQVLWLIILIDDLVWLASPAADLNGMNLICKPASCNGVLRLLVGFDGILILCRTVNGVLLAALLGRNSHCLARVGVTKTVPSNAVNEGDVAVFCAAANVGGVVGGVGHGLGTTSNDNVGSPGSNRLRTENDGLEGGSANLVDSGGDSGV